MLDCIKNKSHDQKKRKNLPCSLIRAMITNIEDTTDGRFNPILTGLLKYTPEPGGGRILPPS